MVMNMRGDPPIIMNMIDLLQRLDIINFKTRIRCMLALYKNMGEGPYYESDDGIHKR